MIRVQPDDRVTLKVANVTEVVTDNYNMLRNLPKLDGVEVKGDMFEKDPTVPAWAKDTEPTEMTYADVKSVWDKVFI